MLASPKPPAGEGRKCPFVEEAIRTEPGLVDGAEPEERTT